MGPPKVRFLTKLYHPNVDKLGRICLDILKVLLDICVKYLSGLIRYVYCAQDKWSPALQIRTVLLSIQALMSAPNPDDPLDNAVAEMWKTNEPIALRTGFSVWMNAYLLIDFYLLFVAREWTARYAN